MSLMSSGAATSMGGTSGVGLLAARAGLSNCLTTGLSSLSQSRDGVSTLLVGAKSIGGERLSKTLDSVGSCSASGLRSVKEAGASACVLAKEAGSSACSKAKEVRSSGASKLQAARDATRERCGEALSAASAVSGVSLQRDAEPTGLGRLCHCCPALTYKQRLMGAVACMLLGMLLSLTSLLSFTKLILGNPVPFAFKYTAGNILSLGATSFLVGPMRQARDMLAPSRRFASLALVPMGTA